MGLLVEGKWVDRWYDPDGDGRFVRPPTQFRERVSDAPGARFPPEAGRYHLYVSFACPWAHRTLIARALHGLEDAIEVSVVEPVMGPGGWSFGTAPGSTPDRVLGRAWLREVYVAARADYTGRVTVPVLWDRREATIVSNESREIVRMMGEAFGALAAHPATLAPPALRAAVDAAIDEIYEPVNNGVYRTGFATTQRAYDEACRELFAALARLDARLGRQRFLCGAQLTEADVFLYTTLVRFDAVYAVHFKCTRRRIADYRHLWPYLRDLYQRPAFRGTTDFAHIRQHYYASHPGINPQGIVAQMPELDWDAPHGRG